MGGWRRGGKRAFSRGIFHEQALLQTRLVIRKWLLFLCFISVLSLTLSTFSLFYFTPEPAIEERIIKKVEYKKLDPDQINMDSNFETKLRVFHVAKEFGVASMGGLGAVVTALSIQQKKRGIDVHVILPGFTYLWNQVIKNEDQIENPQITVKVNRNYISSKIGKFEYEGVTVHLIGPGDKYPYTEAFRANNKFEIYNQVRELEWELRDLYFSAIVSEYLQQQFLSQENNIKGWINMIHLHGATNSLVPLFMKDNQQQFSIYEKSIVFVYTLHDYIDETTFSLNVKNIRKFIVFPFQSDPSSHGLIESKLYTSTYGIRNSDLVTCVSTTLARDILSGELDFFNRMLVIDDIISKANNGLFFGIGNGIDLDNLNPFNNYKLRSEDIQFIQNENILEKKSIAKNFLVREGLISSEDISKFIILFIGRFQYNKGMESCVQAVEILSKKEPKVLFILMGQPSNFPQSKLVALSSQGVIVIDDLEVQNRLGVFVRAASDFTFIPSKQEAFGLVAAEGLLFGNFIISSGVGGMKDFLIDRNPQNPTQYFNSFFFNYHSKFSLQKALEDAIGFVSRLEPSKRDEIMKQFTRDALSLSWEDQVGPTFKYSLAYYQGWKLKNELDPERFILDIRETRLRKY